MSGSVSVIHILAIAVIAPGAISVYRKFVPLGWIRFGTSSFFVDPSSL